MTHHDVVKLQFGKAHTFTAINIDVYLRKNFKKDWKWGFEGANTALKSFKVSDYAFK